ncbi:hypothetical protein MJO55_25690 [Mycolicibacterium rufum]|uniref:Uncharacterized protein n=2 Tax=Mycolicibacterium rufum TaxID=318424 RepID=A0ABY3UCU4_9MYCO|nr:hypothetical protein [Mycolicibacterium rufum]ULP36534.1 hypothetical protein MJO55_25690 [Mycolicibacterium rufum]
MAVLFIGSQIARAVGQDVDWYTGFGQWLGALASFAAAGAAVWIATTDRRRNDDTRAREQARHESDLAREAGLVQVTSEIFGRRQGAGPMLDAAGIGINNRRSDHVFDIKIAKLIHGGTAVPFDLKSDVEFMNGWATSPVREKHETRFPQSHELRGITIHSDELLVIYQPSDLPNTVADYVAVDYTDRSGRRWQVDTDGAVKRL